MSESKRPVEVQPMYWIIMEDKATWLGIVQAKSKEEAAKSKGVSLKSIVGPFESSDSALSHTVDTLNDTIRACSQQIAAIRSTQVFNRYKVNHGCELLAQRQRKASEGICVLHSYSKGDKRCLS